MNLDISLTLWLNQLAQQSVIFGAVLIFFAQYLPHLVVVIFLALVGLAAYSLRRKLEIIGWGLMAGLLARFGVVSLIRFFYHRPRPFITYSLLPLVPEGGFSFPSGHAAFFFALSTVIYFYNQRWGIYFLVASFLISISRVAVGVHYPSDVMAGAAIGWLVAYLLLVLRRLIKRRVIQV